jgi:hypothetical protein
MKKQLIAAAVAASMSAVALADISITGDAKFEYDNVDISGSSYTPTNVSSNSTATEYHLNVTGKSGDTTVVMKFELDTDGAGSMDLGYSVGGVDVYAGNSAGAASTADGNQNINNNMYAGVKFNLAGNAIELKKNSETTDSYRIAGSMAGVNYRHEGKNVDGSSGGDATYTKVDTTIAGYTIGFAKLDADRASLLTEDDSGEFAQSVAAKQTSTTHFMNGTTTATATGASQWSVGTSIDGTSVTLKSGKIVNGLSSSADMDFYQVQAKRKLSSGSTMVVTYNDRDYYADGTTTKGSHQNVEVELNVAF